VSTIIPFVDKHPSYKIDCFSKKLTQDYINIIFKTRGLYDPNKYFYKLIHNILGGNMSSRLFVEIREKLGLAYSIKCDITNYEEVGYFNIYTQNENKDTIKCIEHIFKELIKFKKEGVDDTELKNNKKNYCDIYKTSFDDIEDENERFSNQILFNKPIETIQMRIDSIQAITSQQLKECSNELFNFNKVHIITFGKIKKDKIEKIIKKLM
jgi:predicted Zn-dependent peptidase